MELAEKGSLESIIHSKEELYADISLARRLMWLEDTSSGLDHLHTHKPPLIHRDLKPANVLIRTDYSACLCDFGLSNFIDYKKSMTVGAGTPVYQAPEVQTDKKYTTFVDVWSIGMLMFELITREQPYSRESSTEVKTKLAASLPPSQQVWRW